jgi:hypothetical protein
MCIADVTNRDDGTNVHCVNLHDPLKAMDWQKNSGAHLLRRYPHSSSAYDFLPLK